MKQTDKSLIEAHLTGDKTAFTELLSRYGDLVLGYLIKMTSDRSQAEDLFQETFRVVHEKAQTLRGENFKSWLFRIATNVTINELRRQKQRKALSLDNQIGCTNGHCEQLTDTLVSESPDPSGEAFQEELKQQVRSAVELLPQKQKITLILAYYQQLTYAEVATVMDCSVGTVKTQMFRALKTLAQKLPDVSGVLE
ncbi:MAG: RNA polymerase sigma factor [Planctomycetota bacterium]